jgi:hypothetical protein
MKRILAAALLTLAACGPPSPPDVLDEIIEGSGRVVGKVVTLKTSPSLKLTSLDDAARTWVEWGWRKGDDGACKGSALPQGSVARAYEITLIGVLEEKTPTVDLRLCATQIANPKNIAAIGYVVASRPGESIKSYK